MSGMAAASARPQTEGKQAPPVLRPGSPPLARRVDHPGFPLDGPPPCERRAVTTRRGGDRMTTEPSGVDLARQALAAAREQVKENRGHRKEKPKRRTGGGAAASRSDSAPRSPG